MDDTIQELNKAELLFVFNNSDLRSEGMLIEMGYALAKGLPIDDLVSQISTLQL
jgi:hypothetical protein